MRPLKAPEPARMNRKGELSMFQVVIVVLLLVAFLALMFIAYLKWKVPVGGTISQYDQTAGKLANLFPY